MERGPTARPTGRKRTPADGCSLPRSYRPRRGVHKDAPAAERRSGDGRSGASRRSVHERELVCVDVVRDLAAQVRRLDIWIPEVDP